MPAPRARAATRALALAARGQGEHGDDAVAASPAEDSRWRRVGGEAEGISKAGLRKLRRQIDEEASASETIGTLVNDIIVEGQELLTTEASVILQRCSRLAEAAETGELLAGLSASTRAEAEAEFLLQTLEKEVVAELHTPWAVSVKKWRQKALAVEKYRSTNPTANAAVYTYMTNCCLREGMWEVAYDALTYAGLMSAGPFFVSDADLGLGLRTVVLDVDKMACYVAEKILDIDLDVWRRRGGDATAGADTVGNRKPGVGIEEINFSQNEDSATHFAALRVQDMTLAAARVALRKIRTGLRATADVSSPADSGGGGGGVGDENSPQGLSLVILSSATVATLHLGELLLPARAMETLLSLDFAGPVQADADLGERFSNDPGIARSLSLLPEASAPVVIHGEALEAWLGQPDDHRAIEGEQ